MLIIKLQKDPFSLFYIVFLYLNDKNGDLGLTFLLTCTFTINASKHIHDTVMLISRMR